MLRVLHVINGSAIGGAERLLLSVLAHHDRSIVHSTVCNTIFSGGEFVDELRAAGHEVIELPAQGVAAMPMLTLKLARTLRRGKYDVVQTHLLHSSILGQAAARLARQPITIVTRHYTEEGYAGKGRIMRVLDARAARAATHVAAVSGAVRDHLIQTGVPADRITVVHNGIDVQAIDRALAQNARAHGDGIHFVTVGSLTRRKGHATLIRAVARIPPTIPLRVTIVGDGPERAELSALIAETGVGSRVELAGYRSDAWAFLAGADAYVQPSLQESFGISVLEAMAARLPVVASRTGGIPEIVTSDADGILVPAGDADALAAALIRIATDAPLRERLGAAARERVESTFSIDQTARNYERLYLRLAQPARRSA